jgi:hypothetical protein
MNAIADALRNVTATMQREIDAGGRSTHIDAEDLIDIFLALADAIDPPNMTLVDPGSACPGCGERRETILVWQEDQSVRCGRCRTTYIPGCPGR